MNQSVVLRVVGVIAFLLAVLAFLMYRDLSKARKLAEPPVRIEWGGISINIPSDFVLESWPALGYPAYTIKKKHSERTRDALYFSMDPSFNGSSVSRMLTMDQCRRMSKYCVSVFVEQQTISNPFCRAAVLRGDKTGRGYELSVQFEFDDSGNSLSYVGGPKEFIDYADLVNSAIKQYGDRHGMRWTTGKECIEQVLRAAIDVEPDLAKERPRRKPSTD